MYKVWISGRRLVLEKYTWGMTVFRRMGLGESWEGGDIAGLSPGTPTGKEAETSAKETAPVFWPLDLEPGCILTPIPTPCHSSC